MQLRSLTYCGQGGTVFPDFTGENGRDWWHKQLAQYMARVPLDGVWLDMNEIGTLCGGHCPKALDSPWPYDIHTLDWDNLESEICTSLGQCAREDSPLNYLSWDPLNNERLIYNRTLDMTADLAMGKYYDTKAFYALMQARATYDSLVKQKAKRPFVLTRSGFVGSGRYAAHWTGDNTGEWTCKAGGICDSVQQVIASNLWGINVVGADIGGISDSPLNEELMVRWTQLGAFYTFMRNHHGMDRDQEWYIYSDTAVGAFKQAMKDRYQLLPTIFSELVKSYFLGGPVLRHPSVQCPTELPTYRETTTFFVGPSILVLPVVEAGTSSVTSYLPTGMWYDLWNGSVVSTSGGVFATLPAKLYERIPTLLRGGSALSLHTAAAMTISQTRASGISILCAMNGDTGASGETWFDDGQDSLLTSQESVRRTSIQCYGGPSSGGVRVTVAGTGPTPHALPLAAPAFVRVYFAQDITSYSGKTGYFALDGNREGGRRNRVVRQQAGGRPAHTKVGRQANRWPCHGWPAAGEDDAAPSAGQTLWLSCLRLRATLRRKQFLSFARCSTSIACQSRVDQAEAAIAPLNRQDILVSERHAAERYRKQLTK